MQSDLYYKPSAQIPSNAYAPIIIAGIVVSFLVGGLYGYLDYLIEFVYIMFLLTIGTGAVIGVTTAFIGEKYKIRTPKPLIPFAVLFGIAAVYANWVGYIYGVSAEFGASQQLHFAPGYILELMGLFAKQGLWSFQDITPKGGLLYFVWLCEAGLIIGSTVFFLNDKFKKIPYCEPCDRWTDKIDAVTRLEPVKDQDILKAQLERADVSGLTALKRTRLSGTGTYTDIELHHCSRCQTFHTLTVTNVDVDLDKKGNEKKKESPFIHRLLIDRYRRDQILDAFKKTQTPLPAKT